MKLQEIHSDVLFRLQCDSRFIYRLLGVDRGSFVCTAIDGPFIGQEVLLPGMIDVEPVWYLQ